MDENYQLDFEKKQKCGTAQGLKKSESKEHLKINMHKLKSGAQIERTGFVHDRKEIVSIVEP